MDTTPTGKLLSSARHAARRFLSWWQAGLVAGMPAALRAVLLPATEVLSLRVDGSHAAVDRVRNGRREPAGTLALDTGAPPALLRLLRERGRVIEIRLPSAQVLRREVSWPLAAEANLRAALAYQLDRLSPVAADAAYFDYRVTGRDPSAGKITLELAVVPRATLDPWLERLRAEGALDALRSVGIDGRDNVFNFLPPEVRRATRQGLPLRWKLYPVAFAALLVAALWLPLHAKQRVHALIEQDIAAARGGAEAVTRMQQETERLMQAITAVVESRRRTIPVLTELEELARLIPDTAYVQRVEYDRGVMTITGEAERSLELVETLAASELFASVEFSAPVSRNRSTGKDRFQLSITARETLP